MKTITGTCALCGKECPFEELGLLEEADRRSREAALAALRGERVHFPDDIKCCVDRGLSSTSVFCRTCKALLEKEQSDI